MSTTDAAKEKLEQASGQAREKAQPAVDQARQKAKERAQQVREQAGTRVRDQVDTRSTQAGEQVRSMAQAARTTGKQLRGQGKESQANAVEQAAERVERLGAYLRDSDADRILADLERFARRQPWPIAVVGGALGFLAARFLKASSSGGETGVRPKPVSEETSWENAPPALEAPPAAPPSGALDFPAAPVEATGRRPGSRRDPSVET